jgi:hypothetical protein
MPAKVVSSSVDVFVCSITPRITTIGGNSWSYESVIREISGSPFRKPHVPTDWRRNNSCQQDKKDEFYHSVCG